MKRAPNGAAKYTAFQFQDIFIVDVAWMNTALC